MIWLSVPIAALIGYVLGSIPVGLWVCRLYGVDIRTVGSGRTGGTNAWRAAGLKAAVPTIIGDAIKGAVAVLLVRWLFYLVFPDPDTMSVDEATMRALVLNLSVALAGGFAVIGHNWSFLNNFHGGAGGITTAATTLAISPLVGGMAIIIAAFVIWWTRMSSVASFHGRRLRLCHVPHPRRAGDVALALCHLRRHGAGGGHHRPAPQPREAARGQGACDHPVVISGSYRLRSILRSASAMARL